MSAGSASGRPERTVHHHRVVGCPQPALGLGADEAEDAGVAPGFRRHARGPACAADLHLDREVVIDPQRLLPGRATPRRPDRAARAGSMTSRRMLRNARISDTGPEAGRPCMPRIGLPAGRTRDRSRTSARSRSRRKAIASSSSTARAPALAAVGDCVDQGAVRRCIRAKEAAAVPSSPRTRACSA